MNTDALIVAGVVEGAANHRTMGIIDGLAHGIVDQKCDFILIKAAVDKHIVSAVIDAAIQAPVAKHIGEHMILAEMLQIDTSAASDHVAIADRHRRSAAVAGVLSINSTTGETGKEASTDDGMLILSLPITSGGISQKCHTVALPKGLLLFRAAIKCQISDRAVGADPDSIAVFHIFPQLQLCSRTHSTEGTSLRHLDPTDRIGSGAKHTHTVFIEDLLDRICGVAFHRVQIIRSKHHSAFFQLRCVHYSPGASVLSIP